MPKGIYLHKGIKGRHWKLSEEIKRKFSRIAKERGFGKWMEDRKYSEKTKSKMSETHKGEKAYNWKGDKVGYRSLHNWVHQWLGNPCQCEFCGRIKDTPKSIHWANKSGNYLRLLTDWISLCVPCHKSYDKIKQKGILQNYYS